MTGAPRLPAGFILVALETTESTNEDAKRRADAAGAESDAAPDGLVVWALEQKAGKGRRGRGWISDRKSVV